MNTLDDGADGLQPMQRQAATDPLGALKQLQVIDRLEVDLIRVEPRSIVAAYRVTRGDEKEEKELC